MDWALWTLLATAGFFTVEAGVTFEGDLEIGGLTIGFTIGFGVSLTIGLVIGFGVSLTIGLTTGLTIGLTSGLTIGLTSGFGATGASFIYAGTFFPFYSFAILFMSFFSFAILSLAILISFSSLAI